MTRETYRVFTRSARNFEEVARAKKRTIRAGLSYSEAQQFCARENAELTPAQIRRGTKYEFTRE